MPNLTKELFLNAIECPLRAWFMFRGEGAVAPTLAEQFRMEQGLDVHRRARSRYPDGMSAARAGIEEAAARTQELMADAAVDAIFEATFVTGEYATRADVLTRSGDAWNLIEIKSSVNDKPELIDDLAYTAMVMQRTGCTIASAALLLVSRDFRLGMEDRDLFASYDHTDDVRTRVTEFSALANRVAESMRGEARPDGPLIKECRDCSFFVTECLGAGVTHPIFDLTRLTGPRFERLADAGIVSVNDIPADYELTATQERVRGVIVSGEPEIGAGLGNALAEVEWPTYYLDFETFATAVPVYPDIEPYRTIPMQFSVHVCAALGDVSAHHEFLAEPGGDPRRGLAERLVEALGTDGSIVVYSSYERRILNDLASVCPDLAERLEGFVSRLFDLETVFKQHYTHPDFHGKTSIKVTVPALVPEMSYDGMEIGDGDSASACFAFMVWGRYGAGEVTDVRRNLLAYCKHDTLAMVRLHERMVQIAYG
ncbi:MAG: DUF2779 domain-containing protein [Planctomycetes bacterium]|nr:DUF2779 domain-containing protein [Planctomycetota bacterium]